MTLPAVRVVLSADGSGEVWVNDEKLPGVLAVQVEGAAGGTPSVRVQLRPDQVIASLPEAGVQLLQVTDGPSARSFVEQINPQRLEHDAVNMLDDLTQGEAFVRAASIQAAEFDADR